MKKWNAAEIVELNIAETASGQENSYTEFVFGDQSLNNSLLDDNTSGGNTSSTPDTLS